MSNPRLFTSRAPLGACLFLIHRLASADAGYTETVQITGGQLVDSLRSVPFMPKSFKQLLEPTASSKWVHGNQLASVSKSSTEIIDLDQETITRIDNDKKTYTVTPFAQMRQAMQDAPKKLAAAQAKVREQAPAAPDAAPAHPLQVTFDVAVTDPGVSKVINGVMSKKQILTMKAHITDPSQPADNGVQSITYTLVTDIWTAPEPEEMKDIDDFYQRYGKKLMQGVDAAALFKAMRPAIDGSAMAPLFANKPGMGPAAQEMMKKTAVEMEKIKGTRILEVTRFGGEGMVVPATDAPPAASTAASTTASSNAAAAAAGQVTSDTATAAVGQQTSKLGAIGSAFGNSVLGAFHRSTSATAPPAAAPAAGSTAAGSPAAPTSAVLYETTTQKTDFSRSPAPASVFLIPGGFTRVESR